MNVQWQHKSRTPSGSIAVCLLAFFLVLLGRNAQGQMFSAGAARVEITPATNMLNWVGHQPYTGVLDPIFVRALVLSDGANRVAILAWDLVDTREGIVAKIRAAIAKSSGIPATNILINASHTHSAPWAPVVDDPLLAHERKTLLPVEQGPACREWSERLPERCVEAVRNAEAARRPASLGIGRAYVGEVLFNRRPIREDGKVETTFEPADPFALPNGQRFGPVDPTLTVLVLRDEKAKTIATIFNLPCHSVCIYPYYQGISADWPGAVSSGLQDALGGEALFLQGCAGDIVPARRGLQARDQMARFISNRALTAITNSHPLMPAPFRMANIALELPLTEAAQRDIKAPSIKTEVQVIACGTLALVGLPGEPLIGLATEIQRRSPFPHTVVLGYSNGGGVQYVGMPGDKAKGGYEMTEAGVGEDNCGQLLVDAATKALSGLANPEKNLPPRERFALYLLIGQSNMAGRGLTDQSDKVPHPRVFKFGKDNNWQPAIDPLHFDKPTAGVGLGSAFARAMAEKHPGEMIGLIPCAVGGTPLSRWSRGGDLYQDALVRARLAMKDGTLRGIVWHQGENDADNEQNARSYAQRLAQMIRDLRKDLDAGEVPFVAGKLGEFLAAQKQSELPFAVVVNEQLEMIPNLVSGTAVADSSGLTPMNDGIHFEAVSLREFGRRYARAMQALEQKQKDVR